MDNTSGGLLICLYINEHQRALGSLVGSASLWFTREAMFHLCDIAVLFLASLWLVQGQPGTVRQAEYDVLRNTSTGPVLCAVDQPQQVRTDARSRLQCSTTCLQNNKCMSFNYKNVSAGPGFTCEHFNGYPFKFTVDPNCRHYAVCAKVCVLYFYETR